MNPDIYDQWRSNHQKRQQNEAKRTARLKDVVPLAIKQLPTKRRIKEK